VARLWPSGSIALLVFVLVGEATLSAAAVRNVRAKVETRPVPHAGDAADDAALWVNPGRRSRSTIIGTDKRGGIAVFDLAGRRLQYRPDGRLNNVDLRGGFRLGGRHVTLVTASNRSNDSIAIYRVARRTRKLIDVRARVVHALPDIYGLCMYRSPTTHRYYVFVTSESGRVEQWRLFRRGRKVDARRVRSFGVESKSEGCVADDRLRRLYVAEEARGIWRYRAEPSGGSRRAFVDGTGSHGHLSADVEGLAIANGKRGFLVASSQGNSTFVVYRRRTNRYVKTFRIVAGGRIDAVSDTDGIEVTTARLNDRFPRGLFVAQDGNNRPRHQNFKLVSWRAVMRS
jgi:myo-inositol-hexaphosphate 3-phosphohydrolase